MTGDKKTRMRCACTHEYQIMRYVPNICITSYITTYTKKTEYERIGKKGEMYKPTPPYVCIQAASPTYNALIRRRARSLYVRHTRPSDSGPRQRPPTVLSKSASALK